jgi:hypothetical protein
MTQPIRTKWHKILPIIEANNVYLTAPSGGQAPHWSRFNPKTKLAKTFVTHLSDSVPKFVVEDELIKLASQENFQDSLMGMKRAGVLRLPFPAIIVEFDGQDGTRGAILLRDNAYAERLPWEDPNNNGPMSTTSFYIRPFYGMIFRLHKDPDGEYLVLSPGVVSLDIEEKDGKPFLSIMAAGHDMIGDPKTHPELDKIIGETYTKDGIWVWTALCVAMLIMHTRGVEREVIECSKINRKRSNAGKVLIPKHTYLRIGRVYKNSASDDSTEYVARRSPIPHWRRGYDQPVRYGPRGDQKTRLQFIYPKLVACREADEEPSQAKEYHVTK